MEVPKISWLAFDSSAGKVVYRTTAGEDTPPSLSSFFFFFLTYHCPNRREIRCLDYNGGGEIYENELPETETAGELNSMFFCFFDLGLFN